MNKREFRERIEAIPRQREERLKALREEVRAENRPPAAETKQPKEEAQGVMTGGHAWRSPTLNSGGSDVNPMPSLSTALHLLSDG